MYFLYSKNYGSKGRRNQRETGTLKVPMLKLPVRKPVRTEAIIFGDINDKESNFKIQEHKLGYYVFGRFEYVRPNVTYHG